MSVLNLVKSARDEQVPKLVRMFGTPAPDGVGVDVHRATMMTWLEKRRLDDHQEIVANHPFEQIKPPETVLKLEQCFGRYFSAAEPYCSQKCAFAQECVSTLIKSVKLIVSGKSSLTEPKEGLTKKERKKIMANAAKPIAKPSKTAPAAEEEVVEEEPTLEEEETAPVEEEPTEENTAPEEPAAEEEPTEENTTPEATEEEPAAEEEAPAEEEPAAEEPAEEPEPAPAPKPKPAVKPAPKAAPAPAKPAVKPAAAPAKPAAAPKAAAPATKAVTTASLTKKEVCPWGPEVLIKVLTEENPVPETEQKAHDFAAEVIEFAKANGEDMRITQPQFFGIIDKVFDVEKLDHSDREGAVKGLAEEMKGHGLLKLVKVAAAK